MALGDVIRRLAVSLSMDTAAFEDGADISEKRIAKMAKGFEKAGKRLSDIGTKMSIGITAPIAAIGASVLNLASDAKEMRNAAALAGESFEQFQRGAFAAQSAGIQFDKFGDILKDTQDKIGDFAANGGGEMADFFTNIAPKVGVTIDQFQKLSGSDALQLYYDSLVKAGVSQKEMVFYMEALADEGSGLIPILADNGKAMKELGEQAAVISDSDAEGLKAYTDAMTRLGEAFKRVQIAIAGSGFLDVVVQIADQLAAAANWFGTLSPEVQQFAVVAAATAAALGPLLVALGTIISSGSVVLAAVTSIAGSIASVGTLTGGATVAVSALGGAFGAIAAAIAPVLPIIAAVGAAALVIYQNWDKIAPQLEALGQTFNETLGPALHALIDALSKALSDLWNGPLGSMLSVVGEALGAIGAIFLRIFGEVAIRAVSALVNVITAFVQLVSGAVSTIAKLLTGDFAGAFATAKDTIVGYLRSMVNAIENIVGAQLDAIWDGAVKKIETVRKAFFHLYDAVVGHSYIPDMVDGIAEHMGRLDEVMVSPAVGAAQKIEDRFVSLATKVQDLVSKLFPEVEARKQFQEAMDTIDSGLAAGMLDPAAAEEARKRLVNSSMGSSIEAANKSLDEMLKRTLPSFSGAANDNASSVEAANVRIVNSFQDTAEKSISALQRMSNAIKGGDFLDILSSVVGLGLQLGSTGLFGKKVAAQIKSVPAYANGTNFAPGGLSLVGERGPELVDLPRGARVTPNHELGDFGGARVEVIPSPYFDVVVDQRAGNVAAPMAVASGMQARGAAGSDVGRASRRRIPGR